MAVDEPSHIDSSLISEVFVPKSISSHFILTHLAITFNIFS